ncbi:MAG: ABC transporter permease [Acidobacteriota bacterium]
MLGFTTLRRFVRKERSFAGLAVLTLALGIGAAVTIFTVVNGVLFESLPYRDADRLLALDHEAPGLELPEMGVSQRLYLHYLENATTLDEVALRDQQRTTLTGDGEPERVLAARVTPSYFRALSAQTQLGRLFAEEEGRPGAEDVVVLSDGLWRRRFGADRAVLGRVLQVDSRPFVVVGVLAADFRDSDDIELYRARVVDPAEAQLGAFQDTALVKRREGVSEEEARADLERLSSGLETWFPEDAAAGILGRAGFKATLEPLLEQRVGDLREILWVLLGTVGVILAIACGNVANLFLVRVEERSHELGVRAALGASRWRAARDILGEGVTLALIAGAAALGLAQLGLFLLRRYGPQSLPRLDEIAINGRVVLFAAAISLVSGMAFGLLPALRGSTERLLASLRDGTRSASSGRGRHRTRSVLVAGQVALGLVLLVGCGLLVRTLLELRAADPGFDPTDTLTFRLTLPEAEYPEGDDVHAFASQALERIRALPGVASAGVGSTLPMDGFSGGSGYAVEDRPPAEDSLPPVFMEFRVSEDLLETLGARLVEGRWLTENDVRNRTGSVLVSRSIQQRFWPEESAVGKRIYPSRTSEDDGWNEIVGVVDDLHMQGIGEEVRDLVLRPMLGLEGAGHDIQGHLAFAVRTSLPPESLVPAIRSELWALDPNVPVAQVRTMERLVSASREQVSFTVVILLIASALALVLAAVGLYGVISYVVSRRTHEFGIRLAMGADRGDVTRLVVRGGLTVSLAGIGAGLLLALGTTRFLESMLFGVSKYDPPTFTVVPLLLLAVAVLASWIPARRASGVEPVTALRQD